MKKEKIRYHLELFDNNGKLIYSNKETRIENRPGIDGQPAINPLFEIEWGCTIPYYRKEDEEDIIRFVKETAEIKLTSRIGDEILETWVMREARFKESFDGGYLYTANEEWLMLDLRFEYKTIVWEHKTVPELKELFGGLA